MHIVLFEPDIPQNLGATIRLCSAFDVILHVIEPCGFPVSDKAIKRAAMDYALNAHIIYHKDWTRFLEYRTHKFATSRLILFTTKTQIPYVSLDYRDDDMLIFGRESAGVPDFVVQKASHCVTIPMKTEARSINIVTAAAMGLGEALRQTHGFTLKTNENNE